ncbi:MAG: hypothetical protein CMH52_02915 [Myxococcales bacterium]|nr:hypothetical protein [Myxococcales bacterium]
MRLAASLIVLKDRHNPMVYWARRGGTAPFLAGFNVFPGGLVDPFETAKFNDRDQRLRACLIREVGEETGADISSYKDTLDYLGRWITPPYLVYPLETHFYALWVDTDIFQDSVIGDELVDGCWVTPEHAMGLWRSGDVRLVPPTQAILNGLLKSGQAGVRLALQQDEASGQEPTLSPIQPGMMMIPLRTPTLPPATHTNCYVLGEQDLLVVEPAAYDDDVRDHLYQYLDEKIQSGCEIKAFVTTHHHRDHIGGLVQCHERYGAPIWTHRETANRVDFNVHDFLNDGDVIHLSNGQAWEVLFTPGHAPGHICLYEQQSGVMIVGDMVAGMGSILIEPTEGCMFSYLESLRCMRDHAPTCLLPSHGPYIANPMEKLDQYITHRLAREDALLAALQQSSDFLKLVELVYQDTPVALRSGPAGGLAGLSLLAHLKKLVRDGRVLSGAHQTWSLVDRVD